MKIKISFRYPQETRLTITENVRLRLLSDKTEVKTMNRRWFMMPLHPPQRKEHERLELLMNEVGLLTADLK